MRSIRLLAATTVILTGAWACGGDGGGVEPNTDPVANFTAPACTVNVDCAFTDASSDPDGTITAWNWNFGDGATATDRNPVHKFAEAKAYDVTLTVTDNGGKTNSKTVSVTVTGGTANVPPTAAFTVPACTVNTACLFTDASTDSDGTIASWSWNFGDGTPPVTTEQNPSHTYTAEGIYDVTLTVTDDKGATGASPVQHVTVSAGAAQDCAGTVCTLAVEQRSTALVTLVSRSCELKENNIFSQTPQRRQLIFNACSRPAPSGYPVTDASDVPVVLAAGGSLGIELVQGTPDVGDPAVGPPHLRMSGSFSSGYVINIDDGGNPTGPGEPDFDDIVLRVEFTAAP